MTILLVAAWSGNDTTQGQRKWQNGCNRVANDRLNEVLRDDGRNGWELVSILRESSGQTTYCMKRELSS